jgi:choline dehydrogenase-like flavoprotein
MAQLLQTQFHDAVSALVYSVARAQAEPGRAELQPPYNDLTQFVLSQHARMPDYLRAPLLAATLAFDLLGLVGTGHRFHQLGPEARARQLAAWKHSKSGFKRDLIRYYESLTALALYSRDAPSASAPTPRTANPAPPASSQVLSAPAPVLRHAIVVVGSGPGGAITACLLAEAGRDVLLIEEGEYLSLESCVPFTRDEMVQKYRHGGQTVAMGTNKIAYVEGCCVGGGSEINSGLYHRTPPEILATWRKEFRVEGLTEADLRPHFEACERDVSVSLLPGAAPAASLKLHEGATRLGWKSLEVPRWFRHTSEPGAPAQGKRQSMTETFVPRFLRAGGHLLPRTRVDRIRQDGGRWTVTAAHAATGPVRIETETLFICGGAVQTPALLRRSGITHNIGNRLRLHPTVKVVAQLPEAVNSAQMGVPVHQVKQFSPRLSLGCSISNPPYLALGLLDHPNRARNLSDIWPRLASYYAMITGEGTGTVRTLPGFRNPLVRYRLTDADRRDLADGLRKLCQALFEAGATALYPSLTRGPAFSAPDELSRIPAALPSGLTSLMTIHLFSSCPMGEDTTRCATDSFGRVHGFKNLFLADASLLCTAPGVNPQGSVMAVARRNVLHFLNNR